MYLPVRREGGGGGELCCGFGGLAPALGDGASAFAPPPSSHFASALPPSSPCRVQSGVPGAGSEMLGDACSSPGPRAGAPSSPEVQCLPPSSAQPGVTVTLHLTDRFGVWLSLLLTTPEVSKQQKFPLEMKDLCYFYYSGPEDCAVTSARYPHPPLY